EIARIILLHQAVAVGAAEIENVVWVLFEQGEVVTHGFGKVLANYLRIFPTPLGIQMGVADNIERRLSAQIRSHGRDVLQRRLLRVILVRRLSRLVLSSREQPGRKQEGQQLQLS